GTSAEGTGAVEHSRGADGPAPSRDPLTERILARGDASLSADTYGSDTDGEQYDLADRQALRRVAGLSTELEDVTEVEYRQLRLERVVLRPLHLRQRRAGRDQPARARRPRRDRRIRGARRGPAAPRTSRSGDLPRQGQGRGARRPGRGQRRR